MGREYVPLRVRVSYDKANGMSIHHSIQYDKLYLKRDGVFEELYISRSLMNSLYNEYENRLRGLFPDIVALDSLDSIDLYLPLILPS